MDTRSGLAQVLALRGKLGEAQQRLQDLWGSRRQVLGDDHPETMISRAWLGWVPAERSRHVEARQLLRALLIDRERLLGLDHPHTLAP